MATKTYIDYSEPAIDAAWLNDVDRLQYDILGNPATDAEVITNLGITATAAELNTLDGITSTVAELNILDGVTSTAVELNILDGVTSTTAELNILDGVTTSAAELNVLDGITSTVTELNYTDGVTSAIQTQLNTKAPLVSPTFTGTLTVPVGLTGILRADSGVVSTDSSIIPLTLATMQASTSGTAIDFTSIPSGTKRIYIMFNGVSKSGTSEILVQIGDSGGIEATGYLGCGYSSTNSVSVYTTGFAIKAAIAAELVNGILTVRLMDSSTNLWACEGSLSSSSSAGNSFNTSGTKALSATLDRVRITMLNGTDTFDAGNINIAYD